MNRLSKGISLLLSIILILVFLTIIFSLVLPEFIHACTILVESLRDFASALARCNAVFVQETFAARGDGGQESALRLYKALDRQVFRSFYGRLDVACYTPTDSEAVLAAASCLQSGDILLTLGAGNNRHLAYEIAKERRKALL